MAWRESGRAGGQVTIGAGVLLIGAPPGMSGPPLSRLAVCCLNIRLETAYMSPRVPSNPQFHAASA